MTRNQILSGVAAVAAGLGLFAMSGTAQAQVRPGIPGQVPGITPLFPGQPGLPQVRPILPGPTPSWPGFPVQPVRGPNYFRIDRLALQLHREAEELHEEVHLHFRRTPQYRHLDQDVREIEQLTDHLHELAHNRGSLRHLHADLLELERRVNHVQDLVNDMARFRELDRRAFLHLRQSLRQLENTLHLLHDELHN